MDEFAKAWADHPDVSGIDVATAEQFYRAGYRAATERAARVAESFQPETVSMNTVGECCGVDWEEGKPRLAAAIRGGG